MSRNNSFYVSFYLKLPTDSLTSATVRKRSIPNISCKMRGAKETASHATRHSREVACASYVLDERKTIKSRRKPITSLVGSKGDTRRALLCYVGTRERTDIGLFLVEEALLLISGTLLTRVRAERLRFGRRSPACCPSYQASDGRYLDPAESMGSVYGLTSSASD